MNQETLKQKLEAAIKSGRVNMRPRWHFVLRGALLAVGVILLSLALLYLVSLILFSLRASGAWFGPGFGLRGIRELLLSLPWLLILLALSFIVLLELLVKRYALAYRKPMLYSALAVIALGVAGGIIVSLTPLHQNLFFQARQHHLPFGEEFYRGMPRPEHIEAGQIVEVMPPNYRIITPHDDNITVIVTPQTSFDGNSAGDLQVGDSIVVFGQRADENEITAQDIKKITGQIPEMPGRFQRGMMKMAK